jgi:hypothetical protein
VLCAARRITARNAKYFREAGCRATGRDVTKAFYDHCRTPVAYYYGLAPEKLDRGDMHAALRRGLLDKGAAFAGMFRLPSARMTSAYNFDRHLGFGMPATYRDMFWRGARTKMIRARKPSVKGLDAYAHFPLIRGCATKMLSGAACVGLPNPSNGPLCYVVPTNWSSLCGLGQANALVRRVCAEGLHCAGPGEAQVAEANANLQRMAFAGITELWDLSLCLFHRLHGGERSPGDARVSNAHVSNKRRRKPELVFARVLDRFEREIPCVSDKLAKDLPTEVCAESLPAYKPPHGQNANAALAPAAMAPVASPTHGPRTGADESVAAGLVADLRKGKDSRLPGLLDKPLVAAAAKQARNASKPPLEESLTRILGS